MDPAQFAQFHPALGRLRCVVQQGRPSRRGPKAFAAELLAAFKSPEFRRLLDPLYADGGGDRAHLEAGHGRGSGRAVERDGLGVNHVDRHTAQPPRHQFPGQAAVVDLKPLGRSDKGTHVSGPGVQGSGQQEVDMQTGKAAGFQARSAARRASQALSGGSI